MPSYLLAKAARFFPAFPGGASASALSLLIASLNGSNGVPVAPEGTAVAPG